MSRVVIMPKQYGPMLCLLCLCLLPVFSCEYITFGRCGEPVDGRDIYVCPSSLHALACGENLVDLCCEIHEKRAVAEDLTISIGENILQSEKIGERTRKVTINKSEVGSYTYMCKSEFISPQIKIVYVIEPPSNVTDFKCKSDNLEILNCSWSRPKNDFVTEYEIYNTINGAPTKNAKVKYEGQSTVYSVWTELTRPQYRNDETVLIFNLKSTNPFGENSQVIPIVHHSFVKPKPVLNLAVTNITSRKAVLEWQLNEKMILLKAVKFKIEIETQDQIGRKEEERITKFLSHKIAPEFFLEKITFNLDSLNAHTKYSVKVFVKTWNASSEFWSEPSIISFLTASQKPKRPPIVPTGAFTAQEYNNRRIIDVYWEQLPEREKAGAEFVYIVDVKSPSNSKHSVLKTMNTYLTLETNSSEALRIAVNSSNEMGFSDASSYLYVPALEETKTHVKSFTVLSHGNGTYDMMWLNEGGVDSYTLFWCKNSNKMCTNGIEFEQVDGNKQEHRINLPQEYLYQFAIAANEGQMSSGMTTNHQCDHLTVDNLAMSDFPITIDLHTRNDTHVSLKWSLQCLYKESIITGYKINYSYVNLNDACSYNKSIPASVYIFDPDKKTVSIPGLDPFTKYKFEVSVGTKFGFISDNNTKFIETLQGTPTNPQNFNISGVTNNSVTITLSPPLRLNGPIKNIRFIVFNNNTEIYRYKPKCNCNKCEDVVVQNLHSFTEYWLSVKSYNEEIDSYSNATDAIFVKTEMGRPDNITMSYSNKNNTLMWQPPRNIGGILHHYEVKIKPTCESCSEEYIFKTNETYYTDVVTGCKQRIYYVRAVNRDEAGIFYPGYWGSPYDVDCGIIWEFLLYIVVGPILGLVSLWTAYKSWEILKFRMKVDPPKFHPSLFSGSNGIKKDVAHGSPLKITNYNFKVDSIRNAQQSDRQPNKMYPDCLEAVPLNSQQIDRQPIKMYPENLEVVPFLSPEETRNLDSELSENLTLNAEPKLQCQKHVNSDKDNDSTNPTKKPNIFLRNLLAYQQSQLTNLPTDYVQATPKHIRDDSSNIKNNYVQITFPEIKDCNSELITPGISNISSEYVRALPALQTSATNPILDRPTNDSTVEFNTNKLPSGYVRALPAINSTINSNSDKLSNNDVYFESNSPKLTSDYVKALPENIPSINSKSIPLSVSISSNDIPVEPGTSIISSGYVKALPKLASKNDSISESLQSNDFIAEDKLLNNIETNDVQSQFSPIYRNDVKGLENEFLEKAYVKSEDMFKDKLEDIETKLYENVQNFVTPEDKMIDIQSRQLSGSRRPSQVEATSYLNPNYSQYSIL